MVTSPPLPPFLFFVFKFGRSRKGEKRRTISFFCFRFFLQRSSGRLKRRPRKRLPSSPLLIFSFLFFFPFFSLLSPGAETGKKRISPFFSMCPGEDHMRTFRKGKGAFLSLLSFFQPVGKKSKERKGSPPPFPPTDLSFYPPTEDLRNRDSG